MFQSNHTTDAINSSSSLDLIQGIPFFSKLKPEQLRQIESLLVLEQYDKDQAIFYQNDIGQRLYIVKSGKVKVFKLSSEGKELIIKFFGSGSLFGEAPLFIENGVYPVSATAYVKSEIYSLTKANLMMFIVNNPSTAFLFLEIFSQKLLTLVDQVETLSLKNVRSRLILFLLDSIPESLSQKTEQITYSLPFSQNDIASTLGTVREHISRILSKLSQEGLIDVRGKVVTLHSLSKLKESLLH